MDKTSGNAKAGNLLHRKLTAFTDNCNSIIVEPRPGNKYRQRQTKSLQEEKFHKQPREIKLPLVGALVHKVLQQVREKDEQGEAEAEVEVATSAATAVPQEQEQEQKPEPEEAQSDSQVAGNSTEMVLPFGLGPDGHHVDVIQNAPAPSAPPVHLPVPPQYARGQTTIYTSGPIIVNPYIDFIVVNGDDRYMIRCERKSVLERSVELAKLIHAGPNSGRKSDNHFQILNVDKHDFELIVRYMEKHFIRFNDHKHLLKILELADRFNVPDLIIYCIRELDLSISSATALDIFKALWFYQGIALTNQHQTVITTQQSGQQLARRQASKAKAAAKQQAAAQAQATENGDGDGAQLNLIPNPNPFTTEDYGVALLHNALQLIDMHAELLLSKREINDLRFEELETVVKRDTLQLRSELTLFDCLAEWSLAECGRKNLDVTPDNRRAVLGPLCLTPRYLRMSPVEFRRCCERLELLQPLEISLITDALEGKKLKNLTDQQVELFDRFRQPRAEYANMPVHLSDRSSPKNYPKKMRLAHEGRSTEESCCAKVGMNCLRVFVCIFD